MLITAAWLRARQACPDRVVRFEREWPEGAEITAESVARARALGLDVGWVAQQLYPHESAALRAQRDAEMAPIQARYRAEVAPIWVRYDAESAAIWARYDAESAVLRAQRDAEMAPIQVRYDAESAPIQARYDAESAPIQVRYDAEIDALVLSACAGGGR